jgi:hypothetical protein
MNCPVCKKELKFLTTPVFGVGKISNGISLCSNCYNEVIKIDHKIKIKSLSEDEVIELIGKKIEGDTSLSNKLKKIIGTEIINKKIVKEFSTRIKIDERIIGFVEGIVISKITPCSILITNKSIYYGIDDVMNIGISEILYHNIVSINSNKNILTYDIFIETINSKFPISVSLKKGSEFIEIINKEVDKNKNTNKNEDPYKSIENLFELKEKGIITEEEFEIKKKQILGI